MQEYQNINQVTGLMCDEKFYWHDGGNYNQQDPFQQPIKHFESAESKRRMYNLLEVSGLLDNDSQLRNQKEKGQKEVIKIIKPSELADEETIALFHNLDYINKVKEASRNYGGDMGDFAHISKGGYDIASLAVQGCIDTVKLIIEQEINIQKENYSMKNAYCLVRPPGHHAVKDMGMGFCIFNNIAITAKFLLKNYPEKIRKIAIIDYDVHHGNGTQSAFYDENQVLFISIHQDRNYPTDTGLIEEIGFGKGEYYNLNVPLPPGSGQGAYYKSFEQLVIPALEIYKPDFILVSSGFDASAYDPLGKMILTSDHYRYFTKLLKDQAEKHCNGKIVFFHEGGYSEIYVPFCGLAVMEQLCGKKSKVEDNLQLDALQWGYQELQDHQDKVIQKAKVNLKQLDIKEQLFSNNNNSYQQ